MRWTVVACCLVAGMWILTGPGWALLTAAGCAALPAVNPQAAARHLWRLVESRRRLAMTLMPPAMVMLPVGVWITAGLGVALIAGAAALGGLSLLIGWNQG